MIPMSDGGWRTTSMLTPTSFTTRGLARMPSNSTVPVIVVPGIMGSNLRAISRPRTRTEYNEEAAPGESAWRPPNTMPGGLWDALAWDRFSPAQRQRLLDPGSLEVDEGGPAHIPHRDGRLHIHPRLARERGWGEVHADSYIDLLCALEMGLNRTFDHDGPGGTRRIRQHWRDVMACDPARWGLARMAPLTEAHLEKHARHHYPVYAVGYNWLDSCEKAAQRLERRIVEIIDSWRAMKRHCEQVIVVTHSMGGLVARACARRIPDRIAGVIHGAMPALGAPAAYRRIACGTEAQDMAGKFTAMMLGAAPGDTTAVLATSPGALELLPNHLYPGPWLRVRVVTPTACGGVPDAVSDYVNLPNEAVPNPYDLYRDVTSWYRMIDPALADPAGRFKKWPGGVVEAIKFTVDSSERFHRECLGNYYHPNSYAFYGADPDQRAFGQVCWVGRKDVGSGAVLTPASVNRARSAGLAPKGGRYVEVSPGCSILFNPDPPDARGDRTVPAQSGAGPAGKVQHLFDTRGYAHQGAFKDDDMLKLTLRLVARIVQGVP